MDQVYPHLKTYWSQLDLSAAATVLVPLCGKTLDIQWLINQGHLVIGVDISEIALSEQRERIGGNFDMDTVASFVRYSSNSATLWQGDFMKLQPEWLPTIDAIYDKAALIALPPDQRKNYAEQIKQLADPGASMLLNAFEYEQSQMNGPPFSVTETEIKKLYSPQFKFALMHEASMLDQMKRFQQRGIFSYLKEKVYLLSPDE